MLKFFKNIRRKQLNENNTGKYLKYAIGEIVLVVAGSAQQEPDDAMVNEVLSALVEELPVKQAAKIAARITGKNKNDLYKAALVLKDEHD